MNKELLREQIKDKKGSSYKFIFNGSRNQIEEFSGKIIDVFPSVFLIKTIDNNPRVRSFSYNDVITSSLEIYDE